MAAFVNKKDTYKSLNEERNELSTSTARQQIRIARVKSANKTLRSDGNVNAELKQKHALLTADLNKITDELSGMQISLDKKQHNYNNLKRLQQDILEKQQSRNELQLQLAALKKQNAVINERASDTLKNIDEIKSREGKKCENAISSAKRARFSSVTATVSIVKTKMFFNFDCKSTFVY